MPAIVTGISEVVSSVTKLFSNAQDMKLQQEKDRSALTQSVMDYQTAKLNAAAAAAAANKPANYTVLYVVGSLLVVGVLVFAGIMMSKKAAANSGKVKTVVEKTGAATARAATPSTGAAVSAKG